MKKNKKIVILSLLITSIVSLFLISYYLIQSLLMNKTTDINPIQTTLDEKTETKKSEPKIADKLNNYKLKKKSNKLKNYNNQNNRIKRKTDVFIVGDDNFSLIFEDERLSKVFKSIIIKDMNLIFNHLKYKIVDRLSKVTIDSRIIISNKAIFCYGKGEYWPDEYNYFGALVEQNGEYVLTVTKQLSKAYQKALFLKSENEEKFKELDEFITAFNTAYSSEIKKEIDNWFYFHGNEHKMKEKFLKNPEQLFAQYNSYKIRQPCLLDIKNSNLTTNKELIAVTYLLDDSGIPISETALIFDDNRWKILIPSYGT